MGASLLAVAKSIYYTVMAKAKFGKGKAEKTLLTM